jgi:hypothetical protein
MRPALALLVLLSVSAGCRGAREAVGPDAARLGARVAAIHARAAARDTLALPAHPRSLALGVLNGRLDARDALIEGQHYDAFVTELRAGAALEADLRSEDFRPVLAVLDPSGEARYGETRADTTGLARLAMEAAAPGRYLLLVLPAEEGGLGTYQLDVRTTGPVVAYPPELLR